MKDGHLNKCIQCCIEYAEEARRDPILGERIRERDRKRSKTKKRKSKALESQRRSRSKDPEKNTARHAVKKCLLLGKLIRCPCEVCGNPKSQAHHVDYSKPLEVRWFCFKHHRTFAHKQIVS